MTLHEENDFELRALDKTIWESWIYHNCHPSAGRLPDHAVSRAADCLGTKECNICETPIPNDILGLWTLHNFETFQNYDLDL